MLMPTHKLVVPTLGEMVQKVRDGKGNLFQVLYAWLLARIGERLA
jgi:hypothetical protein